MPMQLCVCSAVIIRMLEGQGGRRRRSSRDIHSLTASMDNDGATLVRRTINRNTNNRGGGVGGSGGGGGGGGVGGGRGGLSGSVTSAADGSSSVKTKITDGLMRFSKLNLTGRGDNKGNKVICIDREAHRTSIDGESHRASLSSSSNNNTDLLERAYKKGCSLDAGGVGVGAGAGGFSKGSQRKPVVINFQSHPSSNPRQSADLDLRKSLGKPGERIWEAQKREVVELRSAHVETDVAECVAEEVNARVRAADMPSKMQAHAFRSARRECDAHHIFSSKQMAFALKKEFDKAYGPAWHCIVGTSFGSFVTHSVGGFLYFSIDKVSILLFQTAVERLD